MEVIFAFWESKKGPKNASWHKSLLIVEGAFHNFPSALEINIVQSVHPLR